MSNLNPLFVAVGFGVLLLSLTIHEAAHAWTADRLGDPTARLLGRVSINPIVHIDPIGTLLLPIVAILSHLPIIGWAKPVPVNTRNLRRPRRDFVLVAAAGPISNLLQAIVAAVLLRMVLAAAHPAALLLNALFLATEINLLLAFFNLIPVPPLDGGNVLAGLLPPRAARSFGEFRRYGFLVLYGLLLTGALEAMIGPPTNLCMRMLLP
ncbi:MAG TPA: site-2 protease family protein [Vicinamibacterales bacterium]|nr:site-2 protease family protein [Vicinamibacterales bacterium]